MSDFRKSVIETFRQHQTNGWFHPYTCSGGGGCSDIELEPVEKDGDVYLVCPECGREQRMTAFDAFLVAGVAARGNPFGE